MSSCPALFLCASVALSVGGCTVVSDEPLFSPSQASTHPLAEGLWAMSGPACDVTPNPAGKLPDCSAPVTIARGQMSWDTGAALAHAFGPAGQGLAAFPLPKTSAFMLVDGDPPIVEMINGASNGPPPASAPTSPREPLKPSYLGLRPLHMTVAGVIDLAVVWPVICPGDPAHADGFTVTGGKCVVRTPDALRAQARVLPPFQSIFLTWVALQP